MPRRRRGAAVGVVGLGVMGSAISQNLARAGFRVFGYDVVAAPRRRLAAAGGTAAGSAGEVGERAPIVLTSLPGSSALARVARELSARAPRGRIVIETSTLPIEDKERARATLAKSGIVMLDCPLSGTGAQARTRDLVVFASGASRRAYARALPVLKGFSRSQHWLGAFGNGSRMKFVANLLVAIHNVSTAEAFVLGERAGLDRRTILRVAGDGAGTSRMFQVRGPMMVARRYRPATMSIRLWQKDMKIIAAFARRLGCKVPLFAATAPLYRKALAAGLGGEDTAAVHALLERMSGIRKARRKHG
jgi:3-hydroxyisobutyrate dehydrogenase-like beta-hydroxyacid dehydrogenase